MNPANMTRNNKRNRSVLEGNNEDDLQEKIATISVKISTQKKVLEDASNAPAETQLSLQKQLNYLRDQLDALREQLLDAYKVGIEGKIIYT